MKLVTWSGILLSVALLIYIASLFPLGAALKAIELADSRWLVAGALVYMVQFPLRGVRWAILLRPVKRVKYSTATEVFAIGFMANNVLPARLGDLARALVLARREKIPAAATFSTVVLERIFDGLIVAGFLSTVLWLEPPNDERVGTVAVLMGAVFAGAVLVAALVSWNEERVLSLIRIFLGWLPERFSSSAARLVKKLSRGLHTLKSPGETLLVLFISLVIWSAEVVVYALAQKAFGLTISPLGLTLIMAVLTFGLTAPSAPGFIGVYEGAIIAAIGVYGIGGPVALAFAVAMHLIHYVPGTLLGVYSAWRAGIRLKELRGAAIEIERTADYEGTGVRSNTAEAPAP